MHSNFITPPDYIETILIIDATQAQTQSIAEYCQNSNNSYNIYLYNTDMNDVEWLTRISDRADVILKARGTEVQTISRHFPTWFGPEEKFKNPIDYFDK